MAGIVLLITRFSSRILKLISIWVKSLKIIVLLSLMVNVAYPFNWKDLWWTSEQQGKALMQKGAFAEAEEKFKTFDWKATAAYRGNRLEQAVSYYQSLGTAESYYNQGNALAHLGRFEAALKAYDKTLALNPTHKDAQYNRAKIKTFLDEQSKKSQQSKKESQEQSQTTDKKDEKETNDSKHANQNQEKTPQNSADQSEQSDNTASEAKVDKEHPQNKEDEKKQESSSAESKADEQKKAQASQQENATSAETPSNAKQEQKHTDSEQDKAQAKKDDATTDTDSRSDKEQSDLQNIEQAKQGNAAQSSPTKAKEDSKNIITKSTPDHAPQEDKKRQAHAQWLRLIPDDPGGLLREKFLREHQRQAQQYEE